MDGTIWLTSDTHFNHDKDFIWKPRGFTNVNEMNEAILEKWNQTVKESDIIYHLGDVMMGTDFAWALKNLSKLKGKKYLAFGNHCTDNKIKFYREHCFFEEINMGYRFKKSKLVLILSHYPQYVANHEDKQPVWSIHGHTHQTTNFNENLFHCYHVGVDSHNCMPVNLEELVLEIKNLRKE